MKLKYIIAFLFLGVAFSIDTLCALASPFCGNDEIYSTRQTGQFTGFFSGNTDSTFNVIDFEGTIDDEPNRGMHYRILDGSLPFSKQIDRNNTIYEIRYDFDLSSAPQSVKLEKKTSIRKTVYYLNPKPVSLKTKQTILMSDGSVVLDEKLTKVLGVESYTSAGPENVYIANKKSGTYIFKTHGYVEIPSGCILKFNGGSIANGTIVGSDTEIVSDESFILKNVCLSGTGFGNVKAENIGVVSDNPSNSSNFNDFVSRIDLPSVNIIFGTHTYVFSEPIYLKTGTNLIGQNHAIGAPSGTTPRPHLTVIKCNTNGPTINIMPSQRGYLSIKNISFSGAPGADGINIEGNPYAPNIIIDNCNIHDFSDGIGLILRGTWRSHISNCSIGRCGCGIFLNSGTGNDGLHVTEFNSVNVEGCSVGVYNNEGIATMMNFINCTIEGIKAGYAGTSVPKEVTYSSHVLQRYGLKNASELGIAVCSLGAFGANFIGCYFEANQEYMYFSRQSVVGLYGNLINGGSMTKEEFKQSNNPMIWVEKDRANKIIAVGNRIGKPVRLVTINGEKTYEDKVYVFAIDYNEANVIIGNNYSASHGIGEYKGDHIACSTTGNPFNKASTGNSLIQTATYDLALIPSLDNRMIVNPNAELFFTDNENNPQSSSIIRNVNGIIKVFSRASESIGFVRSGIQFPITVSSPNEDGVYFTDGIGFDPLGKGVPYLYYKDKTGVRAVDGTINTTGTKRPDVKDIWVGYSFFDTTLSPARPIWWNGSNWVDAYGITVE